MTPTLHPKRKRGAQPGNTNALTQGYYAQVLRPDDRAALENHHFTGVTEEAEILRIFIRRVIQLSAQTENVTLQDSLSHLRILSLAIRTLAHILRADQDLYYKRITPHLRAYARRREIIEARRDAEQDAQLLAELGLEDFSALQSLGLPGLADGQSSGQPSGSPSDPIPAAPAGDTQAEPLPSSSPTPDASPQLEQETPPTIALPRPAIAALAARGRTSLPGLTGLNPPPIRSDSFSAPPIRSDSFSPPTDSLPSNSFKIDSGKRIADSSIPSTDNHILF